MCIKLINHYMDCGYAKSFAIKLSRNRVRESTRPLSKPGDDVIARRMLEQNIFGGQR